MTKKQTSTQTGEPPTTLIIAVRKILRPLVRLLLHFRIVFPQLAELLKSIYVEVAENEFKLPDKPQTDTRISLLTGIHRKDIKRLRSQSEEDKTTPVVIDIGGKMVTRWTGDKAYQNENGKPLDLPMKNPDGSSFESLVHDICKKDIRPRVILDEWLNLGVVSEIDDKLRLNTHAFIPSKGFDEKAFFLGHNLSDHLASATHNILGNNPAFFERCVYYDGLTDASIEVLRELVASKGMETLIAINDKAMRLKAQDIAQTSEKHRIDIGLYVYHESEDNKHA